MGNVDDSQSVLNPAWMMDGWKFTVDSVSRASTWIVSRNAVGLRIPLSRPSGALSSTLKAPTHGGTSTS